MKWKRCNFFVCCCDEKLLRSLHSKKKKYLFLTIFCVRGLCAEFELRTTKKKLYFIYLLIEFLLYWVVWLKALFSPMRWTRPIRIRKWEQKINQKAEHASHHFRSILAGRDIFFFFQLTSYLNCNQFHVETQVDYLWDGHLVMSQKDIIAYYLFSFKIL